MKRHHAVALMGNYLVNERPRQLLQAYADNGTYKIRDLSEINRILDCVWGGFRVVGGNIATILGLKDRAIAGLNFTLDSRVEIVWNFQDEDNCHSIPLSNKFSLSFNGEPWSFMIYFDRDDSAKFKLAIDAPKVREKIEIGYNFLVKRNRRLMAEREAAAKANREARDKELAEERRRYEKTRRESYKGKLEDIRRTLPNTAVRILEDGGLELDYSALVEFGGSLEKIVIKNGEVLISIHRGDDARIKSEAVLDTRDPSCSCCNQDDYEEYKAKLGMSLNGISIDELVK